jgi:hypothetical protein
MFREMNTYCKECKVKSGVHRRFSPVPALRFLWLCSLFVLSLIVNAQEKYDINDPRNPDCPCHKMQKQADDEYAQLMNNKNKELNLDVEQDVSQFVDNINDHGMDVSSHQFIVAASGSGSLHKRKRDWLLIRKKRKNYFFRPTGITKGHPDYKNCFRF